MFVFKQCNSLECIELEIKFVKNRHFYIIINQTDLLKEKKYRLFLLSTFIIWNNGTMTSLKKIRYMSGTVSFDLLPLDVHYSLNTFLIIELLY